MAPRKTSGVFNAKKLASLIKEAIDEDSDANIQEVIETYMKTIKAAPKTKAKKDPNAPKRGRSAYIFFTTERRPALKEENPDADFSETNKMLGAEWKEMSAKEKKKYETMAKNDKIRAEKQKAEYEENGSFSGSEDEEKPKKGKAAPKKGKKAAPKKGKVALKKKEESEDESEKSESDSEEEKPAPKKGKAAPKKGKAAPKKGKAAPKEEEESEDESEKSEDEEKQEETPDYSKLTVKQLKTLCEEKGLKSAGKKQELIDALKGGAKEEEEQDEESE